MGCNSPTSIYPSIVQIGLQGDKTTHIQTLSIYISLEIGAKMSRVADMQDEEDTFFEDVQYVLRVVAEDLSCPG